MFQNETRNQAVARKCKKTGSGPQLAVGSSCDTSVTTGRSNFTPSPRGNNGQWVYRDNEDFAKAIVESRGTSRHPVRSSKANVTRELDGRKCGGPRPHRIFHALPGPAHALTWPPQSETSAWGGLRNQQRASGTIATTQRRILRKTQVVIER